MWWEWVDTFAVVSFEEEARKIFSKSVKISIAIELILGRMCEGEIREMGGQFSYSNVGDLNHTFCMIVRIITLSSHFGPSPVTASWTLSPILSAFWFNLFQSILITPCSCAISNRIIAPPTVNATHRPTLADANPVILVFKNNQLASS